MKKNSSEEKGKASADKKPARKFYEPRKSNIANTGLIPELPIFDYNVDRVDANRFHANKRILANYIGSKYLRCEHVILYDDNYDFSKNKPVKPTEEMTEGDPDLSSIHKKTLTEWVRRKASYEENMQLVYSIIWGQCSITMQHKIQENENYDTFSMDKDTKSLWQVIKTVSLTSLDEHDEDIRTQEAKDRLDRMRQGQFETVGDFYERFKNELDTATTAGVSIGREVTSDPSWTADRLKQEKQKAKDRAEAIMFLNRLDRKRFGNMLQEMQNFHAAGQDVYPKTLIEAYQRARTRREAGVRISNATTELRNTVAFTTVVEGKERADTTHVKEARRDERGPTRKRCYYCNEMGHLKRHCPKLSEAKKQYLQKKDNKSGSAHVTFAEENNEEDEDAVFAGVCFTSVNTTAANTHISILDSYDILCDSQASVSVFHQDTFLRNLREVNHSMTISGMGGSITTNKMGEVWIDGTCIANAYYHPESIANILCLYDLVERFKLSFDPDNHCFSVEVKPGTMLNFKATKDKLYVLNGRDLLYKNGMVMIQTVVENESRFTKREVEKAKLAIDIRRRLGYPSVKDLCNMITTGGILNCPITISDVRRAISIYGPELAVLKGATTRRAPETVKIETIIRSTSEPLVLCMDIMFVAGLMFLITVSRRLNIIMTRYIDGKTTPKIKEAIQGVIAAYRSHGYNISTWIVDGEGALNSLTTYIQGNGMQVNVTAKGEHVPEVERAIRQVKERARGIWNTLPYKMLSIMIVYLIYYCVTTINLFSKTNMVGGGLISPREMLIGRKIDLNHEFKLGFGDYVQTHEDNEVINTMAARTMGAISLGPTGNGQGSYRFLNLSTWRLVTRRSWTALPIPREVVEMINNRANEERSKTGNDLSRLTFRIGIHQIMDGDEIEEDILVDDVIRNDNNNEEKENHQENAVVSDDVATTEQLPDPEDGEQVTESPGVEQDANSNNDEVEHPENELNEEGESLQVGDNNDVVITSSNETLMNADNLLISEDQNDQEEQESAQEARAQLSNTYNQHRYNLRERRTSWKERFVGITVGNLSVRRSLRELGTEAMVSMMKEMHQMHTKGVFEPLEYESLSSNQRRKIIRSLMFTKRKRDGRLKSRFCGDGRGQIVSANEDVSSPTVSTEAIFITATIDAMENRFVATVDVEGAFLHAEMDKEVILEIGTELAPILAAVEPLYEQYLTADDRIYVKLKKALYGCVESARLFYNHIAASLVSMGFKANPYDICVFNKWNEKEEDVTTITVHVDDLKISSKSENNISKVINDLEVIYKKVNACRDKVFDYLGMEFDYTKKGQVNVSMQRAVEDIIQDCEIRGKAKTPAATHLFKVNEESPLLELEEKDRFHSIVAKLLYLGKRARPDILTAISFLATRVRGPTQEDNNKLVRVLEYLNKTRSLTLTLEGSSGGRLEVTASIDAAFAVHTDMKSHTGMTITVGKGVVYSRSGKQKLMTKSSTESELVGLGDGLAQVIWTRNFLQGQGYLENQPARIMQDNQSAIILALKGRSTSQRTRHMEIRYFFVKDKIENKEVEIIYQASEDMLADYFSKPLQGGRFRKLRNLIMNSVHDHEGESSVLQGCVGQAARLLPLPEVQSRFSR